MLNGFKKLKKDCKTWASIHTTSIAGDVEEASTLATWELIPVQQWTIERERKKHMII